MLQGLYTAANGMMTVEQQQAVIANNIANSSTTGFKRQLAIQQGYDTPYAKDGTTPHLWDAVGAPGGGVKLIETFSNFTNGSIQSTGRNLDVAIMGPGFLQVDTGEDVFLTRAGNLNIGPDGTIVNSDGHPVLGAGGQPIVVPPGTLTIDEDGRIMVNESEVGQLGIVEVDDPHSLRRMGYTLYGVPDGVDTPAATETSVMSGALETSNVQVPSEVMKMMMALRAYAANQQVIATVSETVSRLIDQVGAPQ